MTLGGPKMGGGSKQYVTVALARQTLAVRVNGLDRAGLEPVAGIRWGDGVGVAAPAATAAKSLESAGRPQRQA